MKKCILPWIHLEATALGHVQPCCLYTENIKINGKNASLTEYSIKDIWKSEYMQNLRNEFLQGGTPVGCSACWNLEAAGKQSKRQLSLEKFSHRQARFEKELNNPTYLDLKLGTVCNLKCRSCSSFSSSKWVEDEIKMYGVPINKNLHTYWIDDTSDVWNEIEELIPDLEYLDFTGGEPFLIKRHFEILKKCVELGFAKNIEIHYNTNGTVMPPDTVFEIWKNFKNVDIMVSIDGIENKFEYLRHPGKWKDLEKNFEKLLKTNYIYTSICYSVSIYNVMYMNEIIEWFKQYNLESHRLYFNLIFSPTYLNIQTLTNEEKTQIVDYLKSTQTSDEFLNQKIQEVINFMLSSAKNNFKNTEFKENTDKLDSIRNESFNKTFPELAEILKL